MGGKYKASRLTKGNRLFPDIISVDDDGIHFRKRRIFGSREERITYTAVASVRVNSGVLFADLSIETSGGSQPILIHGLYKRAARELQEEIRRRQHKEPPAKGGEKKDEKKDGG